MGFDFWIGKIFPKGLHLFNNSVKTKNSQAGNERHPHRTKTHPPPDEQSRSVQEHGPGNHQPPGPSGVAQHSPDEVQQSPNEVQPSLARTKQSPAAVQQLPKEVQRSLTALQHFPEEIQQSSAAVQSSSAAVQRSPAAIQRPPKEVQPPLAAIQLSPAATQHLSKEVRPSLPAIQHPPQVQQSPVVPQHPPEEVNGNRAGSDAQRTRKHKSSEGRPADKRDRRIMDLERELAESAKISDELLRAARLQCQQLKETLNQRDFNITELTETIMHFAHSEATTARDDDYFEGEFARLANTIYQWVFRYFNQISDINHGALPPSIKGCFESTIFEYNTLQDHKVRRKEIEAAVSERIYSCIFRSQFLFGKHSLSYNGVRKSVGGTDLEKRSWEVQTLVLAMKTADYQNHLHEAILSTANMLHHEFDSLAKEGSGELRHRALCVILEQATKLCIETAQQVPRIRLPKIAPGSQYNSHIMEDRSNVADEDDDEEEGAGDQAFSVQMVLVPPVKRQGFDEAGKFSKPIIIRKGTVITMHSGGEQVETL